MYFFFVIIFSFWILVTIVRQFYKDLFGLVKYDVFALVPTWKLFAPNPKYTDNKVFYRDMFHDGSVSGLREIKFGTCSPKNILWKGQNREQKFLSVICKDAVNFKHKRVDRVFFYEIKTLMFKNFIKNYQPDPHIKLRQVVVIETFGHIIKRKEKILFITDIKYIDE